MLWLPHDSELARIEPQPEALLLHFAALHVEQPDPDHPLRALPGHLAGATLRLLRPQVRQQPGGGLGRVVQGRVRDAGGRPVRLAWPLRIDAPVELELHFAHGERLLVAADGLHGLGGGHVRASLAC